MQHSLEGKETLLPSRHLNQISGWFSGPVSRLPEAALGETQMLQPSSRLLAFKGFGKVIRNFGPSESQSDTVGRIEDA